MGRLREETARACGCADCSAYLAKLERKRTEVRLTRDPDTGWIGREVAFTPLYLREVLLYLYDGRGRVAEDDDDFTSALWKLRGLGLVEWERFGPVDGAPAYRDPLRDTDGVAPGVLGAGPSKVLTPAGARLARREIKLGG